MRRKEPAASSSGPTSIQLKMGLLRYGDLVSSLMREILVITGFMDLFGCFNHGVYDHLFKGHVFQS